MTQCCATDPKKYKRGTGFVIACPVCKREAYGSDPAEVATNWEHLFAAQGAEALDGPESLAPYIAAHARELLDIAAPFVRSDRPAFDLMVKKSVRYVMGLTTPNWAKVWETPEGRESIIAALEEAFMLGATLPDMGCFVPYGGVAEFIPDVEAYRFAVTTGANSPFIDLQIEPVYKNDVVETTRKDGNFAIDFRAIPPDRGDVVAVAVYGRARNGTTPGELYPVSRLIDKAQAHSQSYKTYLLDAQAFEAAKGEGKTETENGREFAWVVVKSKAGDKYAAQDAATFRAAEAAGTLKTDASGDYAETTVQGRNGKPDWQKRVYRYQVDNPGSERRRVYRDEITNPYDGADRPEMLRKLAGKSFLAPWIKTRNSSAAMSELTQTDDVGTMLGTALDAAFDAVPAQPSAAQSSAIVPEAPPEPLAIAEEPHEAPPPVAPPADKAQSTPRTGKAKAAAMPQPAPEPATAGPTTEEGLF